MTDSLNGSIDINNNTNPDCIVTCQLIGIFSGRWITGVDVDPNDPSNVIVSLGNYSNTAYLFFSSSADTAGSVSAAGFTDRTGDLDNLGGAPVYSVSFDKYSPGRVLAGTEHGVYETTDITVAAPSWNTAMAGLDNVSVDALRQQRHEPWHVANAGCFYIGTHGRGIWRDDSSWQQPNGISNQGQNANQAVSAPGLNVFPNPVADHSSISFNLEQNGNVVLQVFDLNGKLVKEENFEAMNSGKQTIEFNTGELNSGTYVALVSQQTKKIGFARLVKVS